VLLLFKVCGQEKGPRTRHDSQKIREPKEASNGQARTPGTGDSA
jgi:hypothetical protein